MSPALLQLMGEFLRQLFATSPSPRVAASGADGKG